MNKEKFKAVYSQKLEEAVIKFPEHYCCSVVEVPTIAARMFAAMDKGSFNHDGKAFRATAKALGIKPTRTAILAFWNSA